MATAARATCAHLSPPLHQEPDGAPKQLPAKDVPRMFAPPAAARWQPGRRVLRERDPRSVCRTLYSRRIYPTIEYRHTAPTMERLVLITEVTQRNNDVNHANSVIDNEHKAVDSGDGSAPAECARSESDCPTNCRSTCKYKQWLWDIRGRFCRFFKH